MNYSLASRQYATPFYQYVKGWTQYTSTTSINFSAAIDYSITQGAAGYDRGSKAPSWKTISQVLLGGGGGGGAGGTVSYSGGGGGGAGGFLENTVISLCGIDLTNSSTNISVTIGAGGTSNSYGFSTYIIGFGSNRSAAGGGRGGYTGAAGQGGITNARSNESGVSVDFNTAINFTSAGIGCGGGGAASYGTAGTGDWPAILGGGGYNGYFGGSSLSLSAFSLRGTTVFGGAGGGAGLGGSGGLGFYLSGSSLNIGGSGGPGLSAVFDGVNLVAIGGGGGGANGFGTEIYYPTSTQVIAGSGTDGGGRGLKIWRSNSDLFVLSATAGAANKGAGGGGGTDASSSDAWGRNGGSGRAGFREFVYVTPTRPIPTYKNKKAIYPYWVGGSYTAPS